MANHLREEIKKVMKGVYPSPARFWKEYLDAFQDSDSINSFCMRLFEQLIKSSKDQFLDDEHEAMYSTLMILQFYKNTKLKSEKWMQDTQKLYSDNYPKLFENAKWIVRFYMKSVEDSQFAINFISSLCHIPQKFSWQVQPGQQIQQALQQASQYCEIIQMKRRDKPFKKLAQIAYDSFIKQSKITSFSYCCFIDYLRSTNYQPKKRIWNHILDILKGLIHALRTTTKAYDLMTIFLHFIATMLKYYGCAYEQILKQIIYLVNLQRNSPGINHKIASELFQIIHSELKCPGYSFRKEIKRRFVNIDLKKSETLGSKKYYLTYRRMAFNNPEYCSINNLRKLMIYNILGSFKVEDINRIWAIVEKLDTQVTFDLYYKIMKIVEITFNLQNYESIHKLTRQNISQLFKTTWKPYRKLRKDQENQLADLIVPEHTQRIFQFPNFEIVNLRPEQLQFQNHEHSLLQLFEQIKQFPYNEYFFSSFLQFIFLGNDQELSRILQIICDHLLQVPPNEYQKLAFYLIPIRDGQCQLAEYLATKDIWYRRHVYNIFRQRLLMPYVSFEDPQLKDSFPSYLYTKSFHMYLRQAQRKVPFQIFQCEMSIEDPEGRKYNQVVYFINNILMGFSLQSRIEKSQMKKQKDKKNNYVDSLQVYLDKIKRISPISIDLTVRYKEPGTEIMITTDQKFMLIQDLQICNTPKEYFFGYKPNPLNQFIQLSILTQNASRVFKAEIQTKQNFKRHSDDEIPQSFRDLYTNMTAETIIIERSDGMKDFFKLLIDSVEYKDVERFKITPAYTRDKLPLTFPVRCFLPFQP